MLRLQALPRLAIRRPALVTTVACVAVLAMAPGMRRLELRTDGHSLVPPGDPTVLYDRSMRQEFGVTDPLIVLIHSHDRDGIFNDRTLQLVRDLTQKAMQLPGVHAPDVLSLATEKSDRFRAGSLEHRSFLEPFPATAAERFELRDDLRAIRLYQGTLISADESATAVFIGAPEGADRTALCNAVEDLCAPYDSPQDEVRVLGAPVVESRLGAHILADLGLPARAIHAPREQSGAAPPASFGELQRFVGQHVGLLPLVLAIMALVFLVSYRSAVAVLLPLLEVGACLVFVFGLMGWLNVPVYLTMAVMPVILVAMGVTDEIHVFAHYAARRRQQPEEPRAASVRATLDEIGSPIIKTSLTTALGFFSFALSPLPPLQAFGIFTGLGMVFCMLWSLTVIPALLVLWGPRRAAGRGAEGGRLGAVLGRVALAVARHHRAVLVVLLLVLVVLPFGIRRLVVQDSWIGAFAPESELYQTTQAFNAQFFGTHTLYVTVDTDSFVVRGQLPPVDVDHHTLLLPAGVSVDPARLVGAWVDVRRPGTTGLENPPPHGPLRWNRWQSWIETAARDGDRIRVTMPLRSGSPKFFIDPQPEEKLDFEIRSQRLETAATLREIAGLETFIRGRVDDTVGGVLGPPDYIATTQFIVKSRDEAQRTIPDDPERIRWLWSQYGRVRGTERLREVVNPHYTRGLVAVYLKNANYIDTERLVQAIRTYEAEHLHASGIQLGFAGDVGVSQGFIKAIVTGQLRSLFGSLAGILVITVLLSRSWRWGAICVVPCAFAVILCFAGMGWIGIPLGVATSMFASMVLGVGVDYAIHLTDRCRTELARGARRDAAIAAAARAVGPAIVVDAVAVALGFGVLTFSQVPANARLGLMTALCIAGALVLTFSALPALMAAAVGSRTKK